MPIDGGVEGVTWSSEKSSASREFRSCKLDTRKILPSEEGNRGRGNVTSLRARGCGTRDIFLKMFHLAPTAAANRITILGLYKHTEKENKISHIQEIFT